MGHRSGPTFGEYMEANSYFGEILLEGIQLLELMNAYTQCLKKGY